jgi:hypothetical protein
MDAIKIEEGDRRYNIAPRQEKKLEHVYPEVIDCINDIKNELPTFAAILSNYIVSDKLVANPIANNAKSQMAQVTMSVMEEFFAAVRHGDVSFFSEILDISINNVMQAQEIITAQRFVKQWIAETKWPYSVLSMEHLRVVYGVLTDNRMSQREFIKAAERNGLTRERRREHNAPRNTNVLRGVVVDWTIDDEQFKELTDKYFNEDDQKLLEAV